MNALERGLTILELLARSERPMGVTEIGAELGVDKSAVYRLLFVLVTLGYAEQDPETKRYRLTTKLIELNRLLLAKLKLMELAKPFLRELAARTGASAHLAVLRDWRVVYLDEELPSARIRVDVPVGGLAPAHCTALGKVLLSYVNGLDLDRFLATDDLPAHTLRTLTTEQAVRDELRVTRERGYAIDDEEFHEGVRCLAASVRDSTGSVVAALGISGPAQQFSAGSLHLLAPEVVAGASQLSQRLGLHLD